ncbi:hypothetical protein Drorol1_Dr00018200 [Drosera rotundifolia]
MTMISLHHFIIPSRDSNVLSMRFKLQVLKPPSLSPSPLVITTSRGATRHRSLHRHRRHEPFQSSPSAAAPIAIATAPTANRRCRHHPSTCPTVVGSHSSHHHHQACQSPPDPPSPLPPKPIAVVVTTQHQPHDRLRPSTATPAQICLHPHTHMNDNLVMEFTLEEGFV